MSTVLAMVLIANASVWPAIATPLFTQLLGGVMGGFGLGLRWIGLEPWLYRIAPDHARGRLVGFHETLIALAPIVAPLLAAFVGLDGHGIFWIAGAFTLSALLPLAVARPPAEVVPLQVTAPGIARDFRTARGERVFRQGMVIALLGGMLEAAISGLFALFAQGRGISVGQTADLLAVFGIGGLLLQYGIGWLADHRGVGFAALWCAGGTALVALALCLPLTYAQTVIAVFLLGGCITAFLTLALIASTLTKSGSMASNVSLISIFYTASAFVGPLLAGATMQITRSSDALMGFALLIAVVMAAALWRTLAPVPSSP
jgi:MFS family permease